MSNVRFAQETLVNFLNSNGKDISTIHLEGPLSGTLDFAILNKEGYININEILLEEGQIDKLFNLPITLKTLKCGRNLITSIGDIPVNIIDIDISHNKLKLINLKECLNLKNINVADNNITIFESIPNSIEKINVMNNKIEILDLRGLMNLKSVDYLGNINIQLENIPLNMNNTYRDGILKLNNIVEELDYFDALDKYFSLKLRYEEKVRKAKKDIFEKNGKKNNKQTKKDIKNLVIYCIICKKSGGCIFKRDNKTYKGKCGNKNSCFEIELSSDNYTSNREIEYYEEKKTYEDMQENIIKQKMDTFFNYITEEESVKQFKKLIEEYSNFEKSYLTTALDYNLAFDYEYRNKIIDKKNYEIDEYKSLESMKDDTKSKVEMQMIHF